MVEIAPRRTPAVPTTAWLKPLPPAGRWVLHGGARARALATPVWGVTFAESACRATVQGTRATLWLGPDEYLLLEMMPADGAAPNGVSAAATLHESHIRVASALDRALADAPHALVDISHRQFAVEIAGPHAAAILNGACPLDLEVAAFPIGMCTRTVFSKADIVLWRTRADAFHMEVWRSFSSYVIGLLTEIAMEFYLIR